MPYTDAYGTWLEITPSYHQMTDDWITLPNPCSTSVSLFRVKFQVNWEDWNDRTGYQSYGLIRQTYADDSGQHGDNVTPSRRLFPKREEMLIEIPTLPSLLDNPWAVRKLEVKRVKKFYPRPKTIKANHSGNWPEAIPWSIYIETLLP